MATLMLHRDVLKEFGRLPAKVQKKVSELIRKFQEDSTQASINLEKIEQAVDDKVRSARVGDDWRAIVIAPQQGDTFLLMHVDHHDEAYRWCRNKRFEAHGALGMLQVFDIEMVENAAEVGRPTGKMPDEAPTYPLDALSDDELFQAGVPRPLIPAIRAIRNDAVSRRLPSICRLRRRRCCSGLLPGDRWTRRWKRRWGHSMPARQSRRGQATSLS